MKKIFQALLAFVYRQRCYFCNRARYALIMCPECYKKLEFRDFSTNRIIYGVDVFCAGIYTRELQKLIRGLKYHNQTDLAFYQAKFMYEYFLNLPQFENREFELIPVPLHENRIKTRKYNHMELVCSEFSKFSGFECNFGLIKRIKDTKPQYKLSRKERLANLSNAFEVDKTKISGKSLLIMDDICTTGSTFEEMIKALKLAGADKIVCLATSTPI